ncbi:MAG: FdhF/YdeP family oxidoreductase [Myxococcota bacterium]
MSRPRIGGPSTLRRNTLQIIQDAVPFGVLHPDKPRHFREMMKVAVKNRGKWKYAWDILNHGVCDGCSLGPYGLKDNVIPGTHLCLTRLGLLRLNTMDGFTEDTVSDVEKLRQLTNEQLQDLGRIPFPLVRRRGDEGFRRISWDEALDLAGGTLRNTDPERVAWFITSRGITNETYYAFQKAARLYGSRHVDICARLCHAASVYGLSDTLGVGAPNCSLKDLIGSELIVLWGTNLANNQPVSTKYLMYAKEAGSRVVVVNPAVEAGLLRYWVPSAPKSAVFGSQLADDHFSVGIGGDIAFMNGVMKVLVERGEVHREFIGKHTTGFVEAKATLEAMSWEDIEREAGLPRAEMERFALLYAQAKTAVFIYSMGLTQHRFGVENVRSIATLALMRAMVGKPRTGIMPIRGHSGVQGGAECGVDPAKFPGGEKVTEETARKWGEAWGKTVPSRPGMTTPEQLEAMHRGEFDVLYAVGGNLLETMPDKPFAREAMTRVKLRIHQDIVLNTNTLLDADTVLVLPGMTRYEQPGGGTSTSTERRIRFSPEIPGPRIAEARPEWLIPVQIVQRAIPDGEKLLAWQGPQDIRDEIERLVPLYKGIGSLKKEGDWVQWGGERLFEDWNFAKMPGGRARLWVQPLHDVRIPEGSFRLTTRRGKQFNSMLSGTRDPLVGGADRLSVLISEEDARALGVDNGVAIRLKSPNGEMEARARISRVKPGTLQMYWPEANPLLPRVYDPISGEPDYNTHVTIQRV